MFFMPTSPHIFLGGQAYIGDVTGLVLDQHNEANTM